MNIATSLWFKNLRANKPSKPPERQRLDEMRTENIKTAFDYMADYGTKIQSEFDELFAGKLRVAIPLVEGDTKNLIEIVDALKAEDWLPALEGSRFETKQVKQKKRRLGTGEEYEEEVQVASLDLAKTFDFKIPAGPRKGETVAKTNRTTMSRAIAQAVKHGRMRPELLDWWQKKQTFYTRDSDGWVRVQEAFAGSVEGDEWRIILSRHPVDVLRMSDISDIRSCHSEGREYFQCAVAESKGNGLIAYLVKTEALLDFLRYEPNSDAAALREVQRAVWSFFSDEKRLEAGHKYLNDSEQLGTILDIVRQEVSFDRRWKRHSTQNQPRQLITLEMIRDAITAKLDNTIWPEPDDLPPVKPIGDFDKAEIFRDSERDIPGIGATSRVRLRKFFDTASGDFIAVPEGRIYGQQVERFRQAVREWSWAEQKEMFIDPSDPDHLELPKQEYLVRQGGSWSDNPDGSILNKFFSMSGRNINSYSGSTEHDVGDEGEGDAEAAFNEAEAELEETLSAANNRAEHVDFDAAVDPDFDPEYADYPAVHGAARVSFDFVIGWKGRVDPAIRDGYHWVDEPRGYTTLPNTSNYDSSNYDLFIKTIEDAFPASVGNVDWDVRGPRPGLGHQGDVGSGGTEGPDAGSVLVVNLQMDFEEATSSEYDSFADYVIDDIDDKYDVIYEKIRRTLVDEEFIARSDLDNLLDDIREQGNKLKTWEVLGFEEDGTLDSDGEIWYLFKPGGHQLMPLGDLPSILGNAPEAVVQLFGGAAARDGTNGREVAPGVLFMNIMAEKLKPLQDAANNHAEAQVELDFGEAYARPSYKGVDFGHAQVRIVHSWKVGQTVLPLEISMKVIVESSADEADITGAFEFMQFVDAYPNQIHNALTSTFQEFVDNALIKKEEKDRRYIDGSVMETEIAALKSKYSASADIGHVAAEQAMLLALFIQQNWGEFNKFEKYGAIENYLVPLRTGSANAYGMWDNDRNTPAAWDGIIRSKMALAKVSNSGSYSFGSDWRPGPNRLAIFQNKAGMTPEESVLAMKKWEHIKDEAIRAEAWAAVNAGDKATYNKIVDKEIERLLDDRLGPGRRQGHGRHPLDEPEEPTRGTLGAPITLQESIEDQIIKVDNMLNERTPIDLRIYKVALGCIVDTSIAGRDSQIENQIRGIKEVTTVRNVLELERDVGPTSVYRVYEIKFELYGQQARDVYRDAVLAPSIEKDVTGVTVRDRGMPELADAPLREWGGLGYGAGTPDQYLPQMVTPRQSIDSVLEDWAEGGVQIYDTPQNTNQMQYHVMVPTSELWELCARYYRGNKTDFDGRYKNFIKSGAQMPVYVALGQNGRIKITGGEDLIWFAKKSGLEDLPVFFSYQKQV